MAGRTVEHEPSFIKLITENRSMLIALARILQISPATFAEELMDIEASSEYQSQVIAIFEGLKDEQPPHN